MLKVEGSNPRLFEFEFKNSLFQVLMEYIVKYFKIWFDKKVYDNLKGSVQDQFCIS